MLYLKPIINGVGNYYVETRTRNQERTDLIINYLEHYHLEKGYMLSFNFNQKKETDVKEIIQGDKILIEAVV